MSWLSSPVACLLAVETRMEPSGEKLVDMLFGRMYSSQFLLQGLYVLNIQQQVCQWKLSNKLKSLEPYKHTSSIKIDVCYWVLSKCCVTTGIFQLFWWFPSYFSEFSKFWVSDILHLLYLWFDWGKAWCFLKLHYLIDKCYRTYTLNFP